MVILDILITYQDYYKRGISFFDRDVPAVLAALNRNENVCLTSAPQTAEERFVDYVGFLINQTGKYNPLIVTDNLLSVPAIAEKVSMSNKKTILLLPYLYRNVDNNIESLVELTQLFDASKLRSVITLPPDLHDTPLKYNALSSYVYNITIRQPLSKEETSEIIEFRRNYHGWQIPAEYEEEIYKLSGGFMGPIKRICKEIDATGKLSPKDLIKSPTVMVVLASMAESYAALSAAVLHKIGMTDEKGNIAAGILRLYLEKNDIPLKIELPKNLRTLFNLLYANRGHLVSNEQIDKVLRGEDDISLWANYKLISRLRKQLAGKYKIETEKGKGYILSEVR